MTDKKTFLVNCEPNDLDRMWQFEKCVELTPELEEKITNEIFTEIINRENKLGLKPVEVHFIEETIKEIFKKLKETLNV